jgi:hypothetical protein
MARRYEWLVLLLGALASLAIAVLVVERDTFRGFFWGLAGSLAFGAVIAWFYARETE